MDGADEINRILVENTIIIISYTSLSFVSFVGWLRAIAAHNTTIEHFLTKNNQYTLHVTFSFVVIFRIWLNVLGEHKIDQEKNPSI